MRHVLRTTMLGAIAMVALVPVDAWGQGGRPARSSAPRSPLAGVLPSGWVARLDPHEEKAGRTIADVQVDGDSVALHVTGGAAAALWHPSASAAGRYVVWGSFTQARASTPPGSYGPFIGGTSLHRKEYNYLYCAIFGNGSYSIKHRLGGELHTLVERKVSGAIRRADATGKASNAIAWAVDDTTVACVINGTAVATYPRALVIGPGKLESTDGVFGVHVDRDVEVRITELGVRR